MGKELKTIDDKNQEINNQIKTLNDWIFRGVSTTDPLSETGPTIENYTDFKPGDYIIYNNTDYRYVHCEDGVTKWIKIDFNISTDMKNNSREIKFRGKDMFGNWQYGSYVFTDGTDTDTCATAVIVTRDVKSHPCDCIGQFTGLCDYKGNEIYEGDIIRSFGSKGDPIIHIIEYNDDEACFIARLNGSGKYDFEYGGLRKNWINEFEKEVIGNIYDNSELVKHVDEF